MAIDQNKIVDAVVAMNPSGDEEGIIDAFGVYLTNMYADYYNRISYNFEREVAKHSPDNLDFARSLLIVSGHVCAFNTFGGIYRSDAWKGLIAPMVENDLDKVRGIVAVINALGWGVWEVVGLSEEKAIFRIKNTYESIGHLKEFKRSDRPECYLATGGTAGLMNLFLNRKVDERGTASDSFESNETKCRCKGDQYCEFVVTKRS